MNANTDHVRTIRHRWPNREPVHLAVEDLILISLLCMWWGFVLLGCLVALR